MNIVNVPSVSWRWAKRRSRSLCFLLVACAFIPATESRGHAQWYAGLFTPSVDDLVNHKGFNWKADHTANFDFYVEAGSFGEQHIEALKQKGEQSRDNVLKLLGVQVYRDRVTVFVLDSRARMKALIGREVNGIAFPERKVILYVFSNTINASGSHELCHVLARALWGNTSHWMNEGLAVYSDDGWWQYQLHDLAKHLLLRNTLIPLEEVIKHAEKHSELITYPELGSFVKFLYERYGVNKVREIWRKGASAMPQVTGKSLSELEKEWHDVVEQADASKVNNYDPRVGKL